MLLERNNVDITVTDGSKTILIEIKSHSNPRTAIREAIGQLLEYAYYRPSRDVGVLELVIIAPANLDRPATEYLHRLRTDFKIPVSYCSHSEGGPLPGIFVHG